MEGLPPSCQLHATLPENHIFMKSKSLSLNELWCSLIMTNLGLQKPTFSVASGNSQNMEHSQFTAQKTPDSLTLQPTFAHMFTHCQVCWIQQMIPTFCGLLSILANFSIKLPVLLIHEPISVIHKRPKNKFGMLESP